MRKPDGTVKLCINRKKTHTDQYLQFSTHYPLHHKLGVQGRSQPHSLEWARVPVSSFFLKFWSIFLVFPQTLLIFFLILALRVGESTTREGPGYTTVGVIRTLLDRSDSIVTEVEDKEKEEQNISQALAACGYPEWTVNKVKKERSRLKQKPPAKKQSDGEKSKGLELCHMSRDFRSAWREFLKKHGFATALKPHRTLRSCLSILILRINLIHLKKHCKQFMKSLVRTVANRILVKPAVPLELDWRNSKKKYKNLNLCTTLGQHARLLWKSNTSLLSQITLQQLITPSTGRKLDREADKCTRRLKEAIWMRRRGQQISTRTRGATSYITFLINLSSTRPQRELPEV